jgi:hypothetical protein
LRHRSITPLDQIPANVMTAFGASTRAKPTRAEKQARTGKGAFYETSSPPSPRPEATFAEDGTFVEEE